MSALTASMGVEIAVVFVKQTHSRNGVSRRAGLRRNPLSVLPAPRAQTAPKSSRLSLLQRAVYGDFTRSNSPVVVLLLVVLQLAGSDSDCTKGRRPNLDEGGRLATPKMDGFGVQGLGLCTVRVTEAPQWRAGRGALGARGVKGVFCLRDGRRRAAF